MLETASNELCIELFEVSGWKMNGVVTPWLSLGYMIRQLPMGFVILTPFNEEWLASWAPDSNAADFAETGTKPEDALARLLIRLFKEGVMIKGGESERSTAK